MMDELCEAIRIFVRYDTPDENGDTRRDKNERFGRDHPDLIVNMDGAYLWEWYHRVASCVARVRDGICFPIPPSEFLAWAQMTGTLVRPMEWSILTAMDEVYCTGMSAEFEAYRIRQEEKAKAAQNG